MTYNDTNIYSNIFDLNNFIEIDILNQEIHNEVSLSYSNLNDYLYINLYAEQLNGTIYNNIYSIINSNILNYINYDLYIINFNSINFYINITENLIINIPIYNYIPFIIIFGLEFSNVSKSVIPVIGEITMLLADNGQGSSGRNWDYITGEYTNPDDPDDDRFRDHKGNRIPSNSDIAPSKSLEEHANKFPAGVIPESNIPHIKMNSFSDKGFLDRLNTVDSAMDASSDDRLSSREKLLKLIKTFHGFAVNKRDAEAFTYEAARLHFDRLYEKCFEASNCVSSEVRRQLETGQVITASSEVDRSMRDFDTKTKEIFDQINQTRVISKTFRAYLDTNPNVGNSN